MRSQSASDIVIVLLMLATFLVAVAASCLMGIC